MTVTTCPTCGKMVSVRFPVHECKLSKWWRGKSAKAAFRRVEKQKKERIKKLKMRLAQTRK